MNKKLVYALATLSLCLTITAFASTPYDDVPKDHWAYGVVDELTKAGIIEGYPDGTFKGDQPITRFEMAKMIRGALASEEAITERQKKLLDKLAKEYEEELKGFGLRIVDLERRVGNVKWEGKLRYRYIQDRGHTTGGGGFMQMFGGGDGNTRSKYRNSYQYLTATLEPDIKLADHWTGHMRMNFNMDMHSGKNASDGAFGGDDGGGGFMAMFGGGSTAPSRKIKEAYVDRLWVQGDYKNFQAKLGRLPYTSVADNGMVFNDNVSGAQVTYGSKIKGVATIGRVNSDPNGAKSDNGGIFALFGGGNGNTTTDYIGAEVYTNPGKALFGIGYHWFNDRNFDSDGGMDFMSMFGGGGDEKSQSANIFSIGANYQFDDIFGVRLAGAWNKDDDMGYDGSKRSWNAEVDFGKHNLQKAGSLSGYVAYRHLGNSVTWRPDYEVMNAGQKGWEFGVNYVLAKNVDASVRYFTGKNLKDKEKAQTFFTEFNCYF